MAVYKNARTDGMLAVPASTLLTTTNALASTIRLVYVNGAPAPKVDAVHAALREMHLETDLELIGTVLGELTGDASCVPVRVALTHLQDAVGALDAALRTLERLLAAHAAKWFAARRAFAQDDAVAAVRRLKGDVDHRFRRLLDVVVLTR